MSGVCVRWDVVKDGGAKGFEKKFWTMRQPSQGEKRSLLGNLFGGRTPDTGMDGGSNRRTRGFRPWKVASSLFT